MTEFQIASAIENYVTSHRGVTNFPLSKMQIRDEVDTLRIRMLSEIDMQNRFTTQLEEFYQTINDASTVLENKKPTVTLPRIYTRENGKLAVQYIGSLTRETPFRIVTGKHVLYAAYDPFLKDAPIAHYEEGKWTFYKSTLSKTDLRAVFLKPRELTPYGYDWQTTKYPMPDDMLDRLIGKTVESYMRTMFRAPVQPNTQADLTTGK